MTDFVKFPWFEKKKKEFSEFIDPSNNETGVSNQLSEPDRTLKTADSGEIGVRTRMEFSDIQFSFPTTAPGSGRLGNAPKLSFPAYITSFQDQFAPEWTSTKVFGRADPIPTYQNTTRTVSFSVLIPCFNDVDANENLKKINTMIKNLYPGYEFLQSTGANVLNSPPLTRIKFANLLVSHTNPSKGLLGYITGFQTDFGIKERGVFTSSDASAGGMLFPRAMGFTVNFTVLHESTVGWDASAGDGTFFGGQNYPYNVKNGVGDTTTKVAGTAGLGEDVDIELLLGG
tara:strand:+ start:109 stop:966 length:858 start_codon:yes stop_codon:yes gene_type:complete